MLIQCGGDIVCKHSETLFRLETTEWNVHICWVHWTRKLTLESHDIERVFRQILWTVEKIGWIVTSSSFVWEKRTRKTNTFLRQHIKLVRTRETCERETAGRVTCERRYCMLLKDFYRWTVTVWFCSFLSIHSQRLSEAWDSACESHRSNAREWNLPTRVLLTILELSWVYGRMS